MPISVIPQIKKYNKVISVSVEVDSIAEKLLSTMNPEFKHTTELVDTIMGVMLERGKISYLYNSLNGFNNEINFKVGDTVKSNIYNVITTYVQKEGSDAWVSENAAITKGKVVEIDLYRDNKIKVEFESTNYKGFTTTTFDWFNHRNFDLLG